MSTHNKFISYQEWCWFCLAEKKEKKEGRKNEEKKREKYMSENKKGKKIREKKRREKKGSESELADSTWTEAALYACLQTIALKANRYHPAA